MRPLSFSPALAAVLVASTAAIAGCNGDDSKDREGTAGRDRDVSKGGAAPDKADEGTLKRRARQRRGPLKKVRPLPAARRFRIGGGQFTARVPSGDAAGEWILHLTPQAKRGAYAIGSGPTTIQGGLEISRTEVRFLPRERQDLSKVPEKERRRVAAAERKLERPCGRMEGRYRWALRGRKLSLTPLSDDCATRRAVLGRTWREIR